MVETLTWSAQHSFLRTTVYICFHWRNSWAIMEYLFWTGKVILSTGRVLLDQGFEYKPEGNKAYSLTIPRAFRFSGLFQRIIRPFPTRPDIYNLSVEEVKNTLRKVDWQRTQRRDHFNLPRLFTLAPNQTPNP